MNMINFNNNNNPLHSRANLFTNGKFGVVLPSKRKKVIIGYTHYNNLVIPSDGQAHSVISVDGCTLIARKIDGMTRQELREIPVFEGSGLSPSNKIQWLKRSTDILDAKDVFFMLDNGVFPFDPEYFEKGIVITHT